MFDPLRGRRRRLSCPTPLAGLFQGRCRPQPSEGVVTASEGLEAPVSGEIRRAESAADGRDEAEINQAA
jgi:hypothetical protein